jgi:DNA polymerase III subunit gamma/tau
MPEQHYLVTARKYRPQVFADLVAQEHVSETLKNAIRLNRLAHLYLFSGPRGVGKTTAARILAKAINCTAPAEERVDGTEPCRQCDSCRAFEEGRSLSIFEIDAASNNKAEDMRDLRETVRIPPQGGKRKVYIVDEVHMLSTAAFNVLLKTLEEPPPFVLFIFATTEPHKVLPTILSRCQRFDFKRIPVDEIVATLRTISRDEGITTDEASLMQIARKGDGALRDALSVFDQAVALCGDALVYDELAQALGVVDIDVFFDVTDAAMSHDGASMLRIVDGIVRSGHDFQEFLGGLAEHLRNLLVAVTTQDVSLIEGIEAVRTRYMNAASKFSEKDLLRMLLIVSDAESQIRSSTQPRLKLELALLKIAAMTSAVDLRTIIRQIDDGGSALNQVAIPRPTSQPEHKETRPEAPPTPAPKEPKAEQRLAESPPPVPSARPSTPVSRPTPPASPGTDVRSRVFSEPALKPRRRNDQNDPKASLLAGDGSEVLVAEPEVMSASPQLRLAWDAATESMAEDRVRVATLMRQSTPKGVDDATLMVEVPTAFHQRELKSVQDAILESMAGTLGRPISRFECILADHGTDGAGQETALPADPYEQLKRLRSESEVLRSLFEDFGGEYAP